jgi:Holliday junction DNA helicase RuvA
MIGYLHGIVRPNKIIDVGGVGYLVHCSHTLPVGTVVELFISTQVREDSFTLYGFINVEDKTMFESLLKVTGVGPTAAMLLIGQLGNVAVADAIRRRDVKLLSSVKGIGAKVAEKIVTLCKVPDGTPSNPKSQEICEVLVTLGWDRNTAWQASDDAVVNNPDASEEELIAAALALAAKRPK